MCYCTHRYSMTWALLAKCTNCIAKSLRKKRPQDYVTQCRTADGGWGTAEDWLPCAIGAAPSAFDINGALSMPQLPDTGVARIDGTLACGPAVDSRSTDDKIHTNTTKQAPLSCEAPHAGRKQERISLVAVDRSRINMLCSDTGETPYSSVWDAFAEDAETADKQPQSALTSLLPLGTTVKVL